MDELEKWLRDRGIEVLLGEDAAKAAGLPMFQIDPASERVRRYGAFRFSHTAGDYVGPIVVYSVRGDSWRDASWSIEGIFPPPSETESDEIAN